MEVNEQLTLTWPEYLELCDRLYAKLENERFDNLVLIGTGGWIVGKILNKQLKLSIYTLICESYNNKTQKKLNHTSIIPEKELAGNVLIVDDLTDTGITLTAVMGYIKNRYQKINMIRSAVLIKKYHSSVNPDYYVLETAAWVNFPYESD